MSESGPPEESSRIHRLKDFLSKHREKLPPLVGLKLDSHVLDHEKDTDPDHFAASHDVDREQALHDAKFGLDNLGHPVTDPPLPKDFGKKR